MVRTVVSAAVGTAGGLLPVFLLGSMAVLVQADLGFGEAQLGAAVALGFAASALSAIAAGRLTVRIGPAKTLRLASVVHMSALMGIGILTADMPTSL